MRLQSHWQVVKACGVGDFPLYQTAGQVLYAIRQGVPLAVELLVAGRRRGLDGVALNHQRVQVYHFDVAMQGLENGFP